MYKKKKKREGWKKRGGGGGGLQVLRFTYCYTVLNICIELLLHDIPVSIIIVECCECVK